MEVPCKEAAVSFEVYCNRSLDRLKLCNSNRRLGNLGWLRWQLLNQANLRAQLNPGCFVPVPVVFDGDRRGAVANLTNIASPCGRLLLLGLRDALGTLWNIILNTS